MFWKKSFRWKLFVYILCQVIKNLCQEKFKGKKVFFSSYGFSQRICQVYLGKNTWCFYVVKRSLCDMWFKLFQHPQHNTCTLPCDLTKFQIVEVIMQRQRENIYTGPRIKPRSCLNRENQELNSVWLLINLRYYVLNSLIIN